MILGSLTAGGVMGTQGNVGTVGTHSRDPLYRHDEKFVVIPHVCHRSGRLLWFQRATKIQKATFTSEPYGPPTIKFTTKWMHTSEHLILLLKEEPYNF